MKREEFSWVDPFEIEIFHNPRSLSNPGFRPEKMADLQESIRKDGLKQALEIRVINGKSRLLAGERRLRSIQALIEKNADCYDRSTRKIAKASEVYERVKCIVTECADDKDAARASVQENLLHEHLTDYELLLECKTLEDSGHTRKEQAQIFGSSEAWVSQSHSLLKGPRRILEAMHDGTLGRTQALKLLNYPQDKVENILSTAIALSHADFEAKEAEILDSQDKIFTQLEEKDAQLVTAIEMGDAKQVAAIRREYDEAEKEANVMGRRLKKHQSSKKKPKPSLSNIQDAAKDAGANGAGDRHVPIKFVRRYADGLSDVLQDDNPIKSKANKKEYERREVRIVRDVLDFVLSRNSFKNPLEALDIAD